MWARAAASPSAVRYRAVWKAPPDTLGLTTNSTGGNRSSRTSGFCSGVSQVVGTVATPAPASAAR